MAFHGGNMTSAQGYRALAHDIKAMIDLALGANNPYGVTSATRPEGKSFPGLGAPEPALHFIPIMADPSGAAPATGDMNRLVEYSRVALRWFLSVFEGQGVSAPTSIATYDAAIAGAATDDDTMRAIQAEFAKFAPAWDVSGSGGATDLLRGLSDDSNSYPAMFVPVDLTA